MNNLKPVNRTKLRLLAGRTYYMLRRHHLWMFGGIKFAKIQGPKLKYEVFSHQTPLIRNLKDVDMQLQYNKVDNLKIAVKKLEGITIYPGDTFSYWKLLGKPTAGKGYKEGMVLFCGTVQKGVGGGLCQLSNLIYWITLHSPLTVIERHRHSYDVFPDSGRTQPFGSGATCAYNYRDLMIRNDTEQMFQLVLEVTDTFLKGAWYSDKEIPFAYDIYEKNHKIEKQYWGGYTRHNELYRKVYDTGGSLLKDEFIAENNAIMMYQPFIEYNPKI